jgi:hypothetical protein
MTFQVRLVWEVGWGCEGNGRRKTGVEEGQVYGVKRYNIFKLPDTEQN